LFPESHIQSPPDAHFVLSSIEIKVNIELDQLELLELRELELELRELELELVQTKSSKKPQSLPRFNDPSLLYVNLTTCPDATP
jgi:hypothetical protein